MDVFGFIDDDALQTLISKCRQNAPDATDLEIAELASWTAHRITRMRNIINPPGLLIDQTAKCFLGEPFRIYRQRRLQQERELAELQNQYNNKHDQNRS